MDFKTILLLSFVLMVFSWLFWGCSDLRQPSPTNSPPGLSVHPDKWLIENSPDFHGQFIRNNNWDLKACQQCHGRDYTGGIANTSCLNQACHPSTPEDCTVCHGGVDNLTGAPPEDLDGNTTTTAPGVGAHTVHLAGDSLTVGFDCATCHVVPDSLYASGHVDSDLPAEVFFSGLALTDTANAAWDVGRVSCNNTYCHGNWSLSKEQSGNSFIYMADKIEGNAASPKWTDPATVVCGTCHNLPPNGHTPFGLTACIGCHSAVIDAEGKIIDRTKHVNGMVNVFGREFPIF